MHHRGQAGAQGDGVGLAVLQALDAELLVGGGQRRLVGAGQYDERREVGAQRQGFGELEAGARRGGVGVNAVIEDAEAVLLAQLFVLSAHIRDLAQLEREPQRIERRPPHLALAEGVAEKRQAVRLFGAARGPLVGDVGGGRGAFEQELAFVVVGGTDLHDGASETQPGGAVGRCRGNDLAEQRHAGAEIVFGKGGVGIAADLRHRLGRGSRIRLDLCLELDRAIGQVGVLERLVGGSRGERRKDEQRGGKAGANERYHKGTPPEGCAISPIMQQI